MIECHISAQPRTPFPASRDFAPVGSMSLDFQVASLSYKSSSFATSRGNERYEGKNSESYTSGTISAFSPLWCLTVPPSPPQFGGAAKGKRLSGQARRLTSPHLEVLCRTSTVAQQNAPSFRAKRSEVEKSPCTMALAVSRGYVSRRNAGLKSDRLTSSLSLSLLPQISNLKSQISFLPLPQL